MEIARLILEFVQALVWPAVVVFVALAFKKETQSLLNRLKSAKLPGGVSLDLNEQIREVKTLSDKVQETVSEKLQEHKGKPSIPLTEANARLIELGLRPSPSGMDMNYYRDIALKDPNLALAGLRIDVDILTKNLARGFNVEFQERDGTGRILRRLLEANAIDHSQFELVTRILSICNRAVHGTPVAYDQAQAVLDSAQTVIDEYIAWMSWGFKDGWEPQSNG
jgi:hypothetical protein